MKNGKYSISDVAEMLGVSKSTVSRAINGNSGVGAELRKKVLDLVDEIGYKPNTIAQSLSIFEILSMQTWLLTFREY